jgi:hypothetical protein
MLKEMMEVNMAKLTNGNSKLGMEMIKEKLLMKKVATLREEVKEVKLFHQTLRTKTILLDSHSEVVMSKSIIIVYSIIKQASCNSKEIKTMEDFIVHKINIKTKQKMNTINKKVALLKLEITIIVLFCSSIEARIYQPNKAAHS